MRCLRQHLIRLTGGSRRILFKLKENVFRRARNNRESLFSGAPAESINIRGVRQPRNTGSFRFFCPLPVSSLFTPGAFSFPPLPTVRSPRWSPALRGGAALRGESECSRHQWPHTEPGRNTRVTSGVGETHPGYDKRRKPGQTPDSCQTAQGASSFSLNSFHELRPTEAATRQGLFGVRRGVLHLIPVLIILYNYMHAE